MSTVAEFIELRESIEALAGQIVLSVKDKAVQASQQRLEEANKQLEVLKSMVANDVQVIVAERLSRQLTGLTEKVETMAAKKPVRKTVAKKKPAKTD